MFYTGYDFLPKEKEFDAPLEGRCTVEELTAAFEDRFGKVTYRGPLDSPPDLHYLAWIVGDLQADSCLYCCLADDLPPRSSIAGLLDEAQTKMLPNPGRTIKWVNK